ncbi:sugar kinase [Lujinxingia litoralis]|uniref:Sugar kinase n=1 Tax=Lujinxingia litoralis TaxID=2211119 RepID=A0A328CBN0_9DELT|nr:PfkB family carbohydrate kinase [Lujinxingia litoralis]RAL25274.1 sugar kinase [Lujinxingia litoralis]
MSLLVVGSVAFDSVETPFGKAEEAIGGSAMFFSTSASYFTKVQLVAVIGEDFPQEEVDFLCSRDIDCEGLHRVSGKTFRWEGKYGFDLNEAITLDTQLNVFGDFHPELPQSYRDAEIVFLANIDPDLQMEVLEQVKNPRLVVADTMNFWIDGKLDALERVLSRVDMLVINEGEARKLAGEANMVKAARAIQAKGPKHLVIKRGEYGALLFSGDDVFFAPAYPLESVFDPTGAGDTFAGGLLGYLASCETIDTAALRQATVVGCVMASFCVEDFSLNALRKLEPGAIAERFKLFEKLVNFGPLQSLD